MLTFVCPGKKVALRYFPAAVLIRSPYMTFLATGGEMGNRWQDCLGRGGLRIEYLMSYKS